MLGDHLRASQFSKALRAQMSPKTGKHVVAVPYHSAMAPIIIADVNDICSMDRHFRFADKVVRRGRGFWHLLSLDGAEIAAATTCGTDNCTSCECPKSELANTEASWPLRTVHEVKQAFDAARAQLLTADGTVKEGCKTKV